MRVMEMLKSEFEMMIHQGGFSNERVAVRSGVKTRPLSPEEAIGSPGRRDYPILQGKEVVMESLFRGSRGQAFTDQPGDFEGTLEEVLSLPLQNNYQRAVFISTLNALMRYLGRIERTVHCRDESPERCGEEIGRWIRRNYGDVKVGLVGIQPSILDGLISEFGAQNVRVTDLDPRNIGKVKGGVLVWDGRRETGRLIAESDLILATGSTLVNDTLGDIISRAKEMGKPLVIFGVTGAGAAELLSLERYCPLSE